MKKLIMAVVVALCASALFATTYFDKSTGLTWTLERNGTYRPAGSGEVISKWWIRDVKPFPASLTIPKKVGAMAIYGVRASAFAERDALVDVVIEAGVKEIGASAFANCTNLVSLTIGDGVDLIASKAFAGCENLATVTIGEGVDLISGDAFAGAKFLSDAEAKGENVVLGDHLYRYFSTASSYTVPVGIKVIDDYAFASAPTNAAGAHCLTSVVFNEELELIGAGAFAPNSETNFVFDTIAIPDSVVEIGYRAFGCCEIKNFKIGRGITDVGAFKSWFGVGEAIFPNGGYSFATATPLSGEAGTANGCYYPGADTTPDNVIWSWVAPKSGYVEFRTVASVDYVDTTLAIYDADQSRLAYDDDGGDDNLSVIRYFVNAGQTYYIGVGSYGGSAEFALQWETDGWEPPAPGKLPTESIDFGDGVEEIPDYLFYGTEIGSFTFGAGLRRIGECAFAESAVSNVDFSAAKALKELGEDAFFSTKIANLDLSACTALTELPDSFNASGVFGWCDQLESVSLPEGLARIGDYAFAECCALTDIAFNEGLVDIGESAFACEGISSARSTLEFPSTLKWIGYSAFYGSTNLSEIVFNDGLEFIGSSAFAAGMECAGLTNVVIPASVTGIGTCVFDNNTNLQNVAGCEGVESAYSPVFGWFVPADPSVNVGREFDDAGASLPFKVITFGKCVLGFQGTCPEELTAAAFGNAVVIADWAFCCGSYRSVTNLTSVTLPDEIRSIGSYAFMGAYNLVNVTFPKDSSELNFGYNSFGQTGIKELSGTFLTIGERAFADCPDLETVDVTLASYMTDGEISSGLSPYGCRLGAYAFDGCTNLASAVINLDFEIELDDGFVSMMGGEAEDGVFNGCAALTNVALKAAYVGEGFFAGCESLQVASIDMTSNSSWRGNTLPYGLFSDCPALREVAINAYDLPEDLFRDKTSLESVEIGDQVVEIGSAAFRGCTNLVSVAIPESVAELGGNSFMNCSNLTEVTGCEGVKRVGADVFAGTALFGDQTNGAFVVNGILCKYVDEAGVKVANVPGGVRVVAQRAFEGSDVSEIVFPETVEYIGYETAVDCDSLQSVVCKNPGVHFECDPEGYSYEMFGRDVQVVVQKVGMRPVGFEYVEDADGEYYVAAFEELRFHNDADADGDFVAGSSYSGWLMDGSGRVIGKITITTGKADRKTGQSKVTAKVEIPGYKKSYTAQFVKDPLTGKASIVNPDSMVSGVNPLNGMFLGGNWLSGDVTIDGTTYAVRGGNSKKNTDQFKNYKGKVWAAALHASGNGSLDLATTWGYSTLSFTVADAKGKIKVAGLMADGTKVSATAQMVAGDNGIVAAPVTVGLYSGKKGGFSFLLKFYMDEGVPSMTLANNDWDDPDSVDGVLGNWVLPYTYANVKQWALLGLTCEEVGAIDTKNGLKDYVAFNFEPSGTCTMLRYACKGFEPQFGGVDGTIDKKGQLKVAKGAKWSILTAKQKGDKYYGKDIARICDPANWGGWWAPGPFSWNVAHDGKCLMPYEGTWNDDVFTPTDWFLIDEYAKVDKKTGKITYPKSYNDYNTKVSYNAKTGQFSGSSAYYWVDETDAAKHKFKSGKFTLGGVVINGRFYGTESAKNIESFMIEGSARTTTTVLW